MKKINLLIVSAIALMLVFSACNSQNKKSTSTEQTVTEKAVYTCPMHPEVTSDKQDKCPKCGMDLVKNESIEKISKENTDSIDMKKK